MSEPYPLNEQDILAGPSEAVRASKVRLHQRFFRERARAILETYAICCGDPNDYRASLADLLTDLLHMLNTEFGLELDFNACLEIAAGHFEAEIEEE